MNQGELPAAALLPVLGTFGFANTTFSDADFTVVGIVFGNISKAFGGSVLFGIIALLFVAPIIFLRGGLLWLSKKFLYFASAEV